MRKYFYFRTEAAVADDDDKARSAMIPVERFRGAIPTNSSAGTAANIITLFFESAANMAGAGQNGEIIIQDTVVLNVTAGKAKDVLVALAEAANGHPHSDGIIVVAESKGDVANSSMTLISDTFTALTTPSEARLVIFAEIEDDLNTDINASVTRDNTTFNAVTLTDEGYSTGSSGVKIFSGSTTLTGSASPQVQLRWKIVGSNQVNQNKIHGVALQWA